MLVNLNDVLKDAQKNGYAVGLFNTVDLDMVEAVIRAAEEKRSPVVIGTAESLLPYGELQLILPSMVRAAERSKVPVVVHYDHGLTLERCVEALKLGVSSIMFDGSMGSNEENINTTREMARIAHALGASIEGEIGHVGQGLSGDHETDDRYTTVEEAVNFVNETGVDALAVAIGTAHGAYKSKPRLDLARLRNIRAALDTPLVLHGGSGLSDDDFRNSIRNGIAKINIFTELCVAGCEACKSHTELGYLELRNAKVAAMCDVVKGKIELFGSVGRA